MESKSSSQLISIASRLLAAKLQSALSENGIDITVEQWRMLFYLWEKDGISQQELAGISNKEKSTITRQLTDLERKGLIERLAGESDKRNKLIFLTGKGAAIKDIAIKSSEEITRSSEADLTEEEMSVFFKVIRKIICNLK